MKVKCPGCKEGFEVSINEYDEGDLLECPECTIELSVVVKDGRLGVISEKEKYFAEELDEFADELEDE